MDKPDGTDPADEVGIRPQVKVLGPLCYRWMNGSSKLFYQRTSHVKSYGNKRLDMYLGANIIRPFA